MSRFKRETSVSTVEVYNANDDDKRYKYKNEVTVDFGDGPYHLTPDDTVELIGALEEALKVANG